METFEIYDLLIADVAVAYNNVHGRHVLMTGDHYVSWHHTFQEIYEELSDAQDTLMELVVQRGGIPAHSMKRYLELTDFEDEQVVTDYKRGVESTRDELKRIIDLINKYNAEDRFDGAASNDVTAIASKLYHYYMFCNQTLQTWQ